MTVIKFSLLFFYHLKSVIAKPEEKGMRPPNISPDGSTNVFVSHHFHDTKSIFCHQVQFFYIFCHLKSVIINLRWMGRIKPPD